MVTVHPRWFLLLSVSTCWMGVMTAPAMALESLESPGFSQNSASVLERLTVDPLPSNQWGNFAAPKVLRSNLWANGRSIPIAQQAQQPDINQLLEDAEDQINQGQYGQALALYQQAAQLETDNALIYAAMAYAQLQLNNIPAAVEGFRHAANLDPRNADLTYGLGRSLAAMGDLGGAAAAFRQTLSLNPRYTDALLALGKVLENQGDVAGSLAIYEQMTTLDSRNWRSYTARADLLMRQGRHGEALDILGQAQALAPYEPEIYIKMGTAEFGLGDPRAGFAAIERAVQLDPSNGALHLKRGDVLQALGSDDLALDAYQSALRLDPNLTAAREAIVKIHLDQGNYLVAVVNSEFWIQRDPQNARAYQYLGLALRGRGRPGEAVTALQQARAMYQQQGNLQGVQQVEQLLRSMR
jgi:tetratricopeptide (TPR) repeat protein